MDTTKRKINFKKIAGIVGNVLIWAFVAFSLLITILVFSAQGSADGIPSIMGKSILTIQTPSMDPTYKVGDMVFMTKFSSDPAVAKQEKKDTLKPEMIITYHAPIDIDGDGKTGDINTHRIYSIDPDTGVIVTYGDGNLLRDDEGDNPYTIVYNDVIGVCTEDGKLSGVGNVIEFLRSSLGFFICIVLPLILFFLYELYNFINILVSERAKSKPIAKETEEEIKRRAIEEYLKQQAAAATAQAETETAPPAAEEATPEVVSDNEPKVEDAPCENDVGEQND